MDWTDYLAQAAAARLSGMVDAGAPFSLYSLAGAAAIAVWLCARRRRAGGLRLRAMVAAVFPSRIFLHPSTSVDLQMFIVNGLLLSGSYGLAVLASPFWKGLALSGLAALFGARPVIELPDLAILAIVTPVEILAVELGYWLAHFMMHRLPLLWEFHKVHHSAEVMTPLTEWRQHPVEMILFPNLIGVSTGVAYAFLVYFLGETAQPLTLFHVNMLFVLFFLTISHLRHSHVWLPLTGILGRLIHSPAHHQIHHSTKPAHFDKNLGFSLSVWDWLFGTLFLPARREAITFGIGEGGEDFDRIDKGFVLPFRRVWAMWRGRL